MSKPLTQVFNELATEIREAFPNRLKRLVVITTDSKTPVFVASEIADHLSENADLFKKIIKQEIKRVHKKGDVGLIESFYPLAGNFITLLALNVDPDGFFSSQFTKETLAITSFNHEIGHHVVENGLFCTVVTQHRAECAANAYAALRHIQLFGKETDFFEYYNLAPMIVYGVSPEHYTNNVIQRVKKLSEEIDIASFSLNETAELAEKIASQCYLNDKTLEKISTAFLPVKRAYEKAEDDLNNDVLKKCVDVMREYEKDSDIYNAGEECLMRPKTKNYIENEAKTDPYWRDVISFIKNHQAVPVKKNSNCFFQASL